MSQGLKLTFASGGFLAAGISSVVKSLKSESFENEVNPPSTEKCQVESAIAFSNTNSPPPPPPPGPKFNANANNQLVQARTRSLKYLEDKRIESGAPGIAMVVTVNGKTLMNAGIGLADVENRVPMRGSTVARIASISKPMTMCAVAKLCEEGKLDVDKPVSEYLGKDVWPEDKSSITLRQLLSHSSGIRHYERKHEIEARKQLEKEKGKEAAKAEEFENKEYHIAKHYEKATDALELFKEDELVHEPGKKFHYSTHAFTLVAAVIESVTGEPFDRHMSAKFKELGLANTRLDENGPIVYDRCRYYVRKPDTFRLVNAPHVDNSWKYAGGGFLSSVVDLAQFANAMLYSYQHENGGKGRPGFLRSETMRQMWSPMVPYRGEIGDKKHEAFWHYGLGWDVLPLSADYPYCKNQQMHARHTGGAVGASSVLLIRPGSKEFVQTANASGTLPKGIVVAMIANQENVGLSETAMKIAGEFKFMLDVPPSKPRAQAHDLDKLEGKDIVTL